MRRYLLLLLLLLGAAAAFGIWYGMRGGRLTESSPTTVTSLLPGDTLALLYLPDLNGLRAKWHETDLGKLWREPAVQDFLQRPLSRIPQAEATQQKLRELEPLEIKDAFFAITSWENKQGKLLSGFRFKGSADDAEKVIGQVRAHLRRSALDTRRETISHERHSIEVVTEGEMTVATVYDGEWFFAANDIVGLKTLLDRTDGRLKDQKSTLAANDTFAASLKRMPGNHVVFAFARLDQYFANLARQLPAGANEEQLGLLRQIRSITAASRIENGKFRDVLFVAMPRRADVGDLTRASLSLATSNTFLYSAGFLKLPDRMPVAGTQISSASGLPGALQRMGLGLSSAGVTLEDWNTAFASEFGIIADWIENSRLPSFVATLPVKDAPKARRIIAQITAATAESGAWDQSEKEGVQYYSKPPLTPMLPIAPTVALSDRLLVVAQDLASAEAIVLRSNRNAFELAAMGDFKAVERLVGEPKHAFTYLDTALLYRRLDAALRPMLVMAAAFMPGISSTVELGKLPDAEVVTRHLSPMVVSQRYDVDGYLTESVGPLSVYQGIAGIAALTGVRANIYAHQNQSDNVGPSPFPGSAAGTPAYSAPPASASPDETP